MKINQMKTKQLTAVMTRLSTVQPTMRDEAKQITQFGKGDETPSLYAKHIREELSRRQS
jgi:hypothetical protein